MAIPNIFFMGHSYPFSQTAAAWLDDGWGPRGQILHFSAAYALQAANALAPPADLVNILFRLPYDDAFIIIRGIC